MVARFSSFDNPVLIHTINQPGVKSVTTFSFFLVNPLFFFSRIYIFISHRCVVYLLLLVMIWFFLHWAYDSAYFMWSIVLCRIILDKRTAWKWTEASHPRRRKIKVCWNCRKYGNIVKLDTPSFLVYIYLYIYICLSLSI